MRNLVFLAVLLVCVQPSAKAQATLIPAGSLLRCTTDDPNFSAKTAEVGDPVLCHLSQVNEFGHPAFPRGTYLAGHLEAAKQPGHFIGKGYLQIVFDRIGLPNTDAELHAKVMAAQGQHVDRHGRIVGKGHAKRDVAEWMFPPLWPWKVIMLPARGPQPKLKNEQQLTLKLMEDVEVPQVMAYKSSLSPGLRSLQPQSSERPQPQSYTAPLSGSSAQPPDEPTTPRPASKIYYVPPSTPAMDPPAAAVQAGVSAKPALASLTARRMTLVALKAQTIYPVTDYWVDGHLLFFVLPDGTQASTDLNSVNWQRTTDLNAERGVRVSLRTKPSQF